MASGTPNHRHTHHQDQDELGSQGGTSGRKRASHGKQQQQQTPTQGSKVDELKRQLEEANAEHSRLLNKLVFIQAGLQLLDCEQTSSQSTDTGSQQITLAAAASGCQQQHGHSPGKRQGTAGSGHPHAMMPPAATWDADWNRRVRAMSTHDMLLLHRQWLQEVAMLLPSAELLGKGSPAQQRLLALMDRYAWFNLHAMMLAPGAWLNRSNYDLNTMQPAQEMPSQVVKDLLNMHKADVRSAACFTEYNATVRQLQQEYQALSSRHRQLQPQGQDFCQPSTSMGFHRQPLGVTLAAASIGAHMTHVCMYKGAGCKSATGTMSNSGVLSMSGGATASSSCHQEAVRGYRTDAAALGSIAVDETLALMQSNLRQQRATLKQCLHAVWQGLRENKGMSIANAYVIAYPAVIDIADMLEAAAAMT